LDTNPEKSGQRSRAEGKEDSYRQGEKRKDATMAPRFKRTELIIGHQGKKKRIEKHRKSAE